MINMSGGKPELSVSVGTGEFLMQLNPLVAALAYDADDHLAKIETALDELRRIDALGILDPTSYMQVMDLIPGWVDFLVAYRKLTQVGVTLQQIMANSQLRSAQ